MVKDTKLYDELEIKPESTEQEIKASYKKLSKIWHPDKNQDRIEEATEKFRKISEAYTILSDPEKRSQYDKFGTVEDNIPSNFDPRDIFSMFSGMHGMSSMSGMHGMPDMPGMPGMRRQRQEDCIVEQLVTLDELYNNKKIEIKYEQKSSCNKCNGYGSKDGLKHECSSCNGRGMSVRMIRQGPMVQQLMAPCNDCQGTGESSANTLRSNLCEECNGHKFILKDKSFEMQLNRNMINNNKIIIEHKGHNLKTGKTNLVIVLKEQPHPVFKRIGKDLHIDIKLRLFQSLYGFTKLIIHLDGRNILLKYEEMIKSMKTTMKIYNEGIGGDLYVHINTCMPKLDKLDENENSNLKKLLIKAHLSEYTKEQNLIKNASKCVNVNVIEVDEPEQTHEEFNEVPQGVQCAQQ
jgi:DnaJ-class molecular chaperone